jgi:pectinesterase
MKTFFSPILLALPFVTAFALHGADIITVTVTNDLDIARPAEVIEVPWAEITKVIPDALLQHLTVKDSAGSALPYQVTNEKPLESKGSYGELLFQHDFAAGEKSATFTIEKSEAVAPVFPAKVFARYVPERVDDFAWENDRIAHRVYGPALSTPAAGQDQMVSSGIDVWCKRVRYLIVDRWYNKGSGHYHKDEGEGMDMYQTGQSRGCGGTGIWDGQKLYVSKDYQTWKVLANGPIRAVFELTFAPWEANGMKVSEVKRFTVDAGHNLDEMESTFTVEGDAKNLTVAIGINKNSADKGEKGKAEQTKNPEGGWFTQWETEKTHGEIGEAIIVDPAALSGFVDDNYNHLVLVKAASGVPMYYYIGAGWTKSGDFSSQEDWNQYVAACAARAKSPVKVSCRATP